ncbi:cytochrome-c peroxidase [Paraburkholderia caballeronis]|uniref:Cytochrome c peroxidase n=1 Tax=Paraburkholderia caballeronis TaxID=416943 RepID=A0A1H7V2U6_9BURK|nr:cytochrome c peroxidase [Paraburkholderia caballeronis]PXW16859.1 cytochrome c peroxidase [Paraburkholderia caballeronis]PXW94495.1 cytochrome c peroxidase [Paraburkholderia caballeronis]RAJ89838.1 cytochrome c peroxidase [Paraburkholderia caballeronis]SEC65947.1 cytochrome c peroxidase [Paraburkholderia caballeronis]SEM03165.1 cytochrome c peroxidase [Paraburkholderia caballeronis]
MTVRGDARKAMGLAALCAALVLMGCDGRSDGVLPAAQAAPASAAGVAPDPQHGLAQPPTQVGGQSRAEVFEAVRHMTALGKQMFVDPSLSGSGKLSCASCHSPGNAFTPANALSVQLGGGDLHRQGLRAVPTLMYLRSVPQFTLHYHDSDDDGDESVDAGPTGGLTWDGRVNRASDQARIPILSSFEMGSTPGKVAAAVRAAPYADEFRKTFGSAVFDNDDATFKAVLQSLEAFEQTPQVFEPYTSKYDAWLDGKAKLTDAELHGLQLFNDETKGNCASCHISQPTKTGAPPQFSDFGLIAIGVPRNHAIAANRDPKFFDLGVCGPERTDRKEDEYCGLFRTPTLRNVALKKSFFHNGIYHSLDDVLRFYARRDTNPSEFYPVVGGKVRKFDDLPRRYWANLNTDPPFDRKPGDAPVFSDAEIKDVLAFLNTLTDGWQPAAH